MARSNWQPMDTAPKDRLILARRHNDVFWEYMLVHWNGDCEYPWAAEFNSYPADRLDDWHEIPR